MEVNGMISKTSMFVTLNLSALHIEEPEKCEQRHTSVAWDRNRERGNQFLAVKEEKWVES